MEYAGGWIPIIYSELDLAARVQELARCCHAAGRPVAPVTACLFEIDEFHMERCADLGVDRCFFVFHAQDKDMFPAFVERSSALAGRLQ